MTAPPTPLRRFWAYVRWWLWLLPANQPTETPANGIGR